MENLDIKDFIKAGVHYGHLRRKWNPSMAPYILTEKEGVHIINVNKTKQQLERAGKALTQMIASGKRIMFVGTKKQAKDIIAEKAKSVNMPYISERWAGGMLTNFVTIRKAIKKMQNIDKMKTDGSFDKLSKREKLQLTRQRTKLERDLGSIADMNRIPRAIFIVDVTKEHIAVAEAQKLGIPIFAMVDTNSNPQGIDFPIPANDDSSKSIDVILSYLTQCVQEGLSLKQQEKESKALANEGADAPEEKKEEESK